MKVSIVIPCYNEEKNIAIVVERFKEIMPKFKAELELVLVDNGSKDNTLQQISKAAGENEFVKAVRVEVNQGYGFGILSGLKECSGHIMGWMHADMQSDPETFIPMIESALKEKEMFLYKGARTGRDWQDSLFTFGMGCYESLLFKMKLDDVNSQPTLLSRQFYELWKNPPKDFSLDLYAYVLAKKKNIKVVKFNSPQHERVNGVSSWNVNWYSRVQMVKRVMAYSVDTKKRMKDECEEV